MKRLGHVLKWTLVTIIAVSLAWIAFVKDNGTATAVSEDEPYISLDSPEITPERASITNEVKTSGSITLLPAEPVKATKSGSVKAVHVQRGERVNAGQAIATIEYEVEPAEPTRPAEGDAAANGDDAAEEPKPVIKTVAVAAPIAGKVKGLDIIAEQSVTVGDVVAQVVPSTLVYKASVTQEERFRLTNPPAEAEVKIDGGPAPFTCTNLRIEGMSDEDNSKDEGPSDFYSYSDMPQVAVGSAVCDVPEDVNAFSGLTASAQITAGQADGVLTLPVTAVSGSVDSGRVWTYKDGTPTPRDVELGLTDGEIVEIRSGLSSDDAVLQFAPGERPQAEMDDDTYYGGM